MPSDSQGSLAIRVRFIDGEGNVNITGWREFEIVDNDPPVVMVPQDAESRVGEGLVFEDGGSSDNIGVVNWTWSWSAGGEVHVAYGTSATVEFDREGEYQVTLTVTDAAGNTDTATMRVVVSDVGSPVSGMMVVVLILACIAALVVAYVTIRRRKDGRGSGE